MSPRTGARHRFGSIRLSLIFLALVPSVTLAAMWGVTTTQMFSEGLRLRAQTQLSKSTGAMGTEATLALQAERSLSAAHLAAPNGSPTALDEQRRRTDAAVAQLAGQAEAIDRAPDRIGERMYSVLAALESLEYYRGQVDDPKDITPQQTLDQYTSIIDDQVHAFQELSQVDDGDLTSQAGPLVALEHAAELVSQEDAILSLAWPSGKLDNAARTRFVQLVDTRRWLVSDQIIPSLRGDAKAQTDRILKSPEWKTLEAVEDRVLAAQPTGGARGVALPNEQKRWNGALDDVSAEYKTLIRQQTSGLLQRSADKARQLLITAASLSTGGLVALLLCIILSWRITRSLSRRLRGLREATLSLAQQRLPEVVATLNRGERIDLDAAAPSLDYGTDELGQVAQAFNTAQRTAVHTAVELADTRQGFQKVILGIARQSQNLVNLQLTKLDTLEREHQDPHILEGLYELDSTASQLRRYEENLVIISGERPGRSWSEPVALIDILRSAVGEVAQYQRVEVQADDDVWIAPPAVADVVHLLAELIDNATVYSPPPSPVSVRAAIVAKGLAIEIEDRGLGMSEEDYGSLNAQLAVAPQFDVVALADDLRLGMFVIARLATRHDIAVTLRSSPYGGTTAIVLVPHDIVVRECPESADPDDATEDGPAPGAALTPAFPVRKAAGAPRETANGVPGPRPEPAGVADSPDQPFAPAGTPRGGPAPLPRRVPQTSLAAELREDPATAAADEETADDPFGDYSAERAASSLAGFQRGTLKARDDGAEMRYDEDSGEGATHEAETAQIPASVTSVTSTPPAERR